MEARSEGNRPSRCGIPRAANPRPPALRPLPFGPLQPVRWLSMYPIRSELAISVLSRAAWTTGMPSWPRTMSEFVREGAIPGRQALLDQENIAIGVLTPLTTHPGRPRRSAIFSSIGCPRSSLTASTSRMSDTSPCRGARSSTAPTARVTLRLADINPPFDESTMRCSPRRSEQFFSVHNSCQFTNLAVPPARSAWPPWPGDTRPSRPYRWTQACPKPRCCQGHDLRDPCPAQIVGVTDPV